MGAMAGTQMKARVTPNQKRVKRELFDKLKKVKVRRTRVARKKQGVRYTVASVNFIFLLFCVSQYSMLMQLWEQWQRLR